MRSRRYARSLSPALVVVGMLVFMDGRALAQGVADWTQYQGDGAHAGLAADGPAPGYRLAWDSAQPGGGPRGEYGLSAPVVTGDTVVAVGATSVIGVDVASGEVGWTVDRALGPSVSPAVVDGPKGPVVLYTEGWGDGPPDADQTPTPTAGTAVGPTPTSGPTPAGDPGSAGSRLVAVDEGGTEPSWSVDLPAVSRTGVTVVGETAVVGGIDGSVTAVDVATGEESWTAQVGGFLEAPIAATGRLVLVPRRGDTDTPAALVALSVDDGEEAWRYEPLTASYAVGSPSVDDETVYVALADGTVRAVALTDGSERWDASLNTYVNPFSPASAPVVVDDGVVVADVRGQVYRLDAATGERVWDHAYNHPVLRSTPVASGEHLLLGTADGRLAAFELSTGDLVWSTDLGDAPLRSLAVAGEHVVVVRGGAAAGLAAFEHDPSAALVRVQSPTTLRPSALVLGWAAGVVAATILFLGGRALWARLGPAQIPSPGDDGSDEEEP